MVARDREAPATILCRSADHICQWPIVLHKVHIHRRKVFERVTEVAADRHGLQKYFGQENSRPHVEVNTALDLGHEGTEL